MKFNALSTRVAALCVLLTAVDASGHNHGHMHARRHRHISSQKQAQVEKREITCDFPTDEGLIAVTPSEKNAGWAMAPDRPCKAGEWCPYACPSGMVSMQWNPKVTSYTYPGSMDGGLYCDENGKLQKGFPDKPLCEPGTGTVSVQNKCSSGGVSFCQTVMPGLEDMIIPTWVEDTVDLAVPGSSFFAGTAAHYYINAPGVSTADACVWGDSSKAVGNWAPFVAGANTESDGSTYVKLGWNPIYTNSYSNQLPEFGMEIVCDGDGCEGLPCKFDPASNTFNEMTGDFTIGDGGAAFCVVTVPSGKKANIVVFDGSGSESSSTSSTSSTSAAATHTSKPSTSKTTTTTASPSTTNSAASSATSSSHSDPKKGSHHASATASGGIFVSASASASFSYAPHVFIETGSSENTMPSQTSSITTMTTMTSAASTASAKATATSSSSAASSNAVSFMSLALTVFITGLLSSA
ncbi:SUN domain protein (Adg3), putative [Paecilomyces variotii No. 5]|uniref:SUN domain protein (Adg3), putative n=1 Tax=Byssochlamys spectabilis (strain No. 5 / NBRC 109023) TaxID=1356009 RepID=V5FJP2_BYSSN|nr:SUN domain protein (Adg3), putative [Paecilomyces variotii No. 5]